MNNKRFYNFTIVIYEDDENFDSQKFNLALEGETIYCRHDQDVTEEGELKKPHYHYVLKLKHACTISALSKRVGVPENLIEPVKKSLNSCLKYLIHFGNDDKYQYNAEDVQGNSDKLLRKFLDLVSKEITETEKVISIQDYIESFNDYIDFGVLGRYVQKINMWDAFRRNMMYFIKIVDNHNAKITASRYHSEDSYYVAANVQKERLSGSLHNVHYAILVCVNYRIYI